MGFTFKNGKFEKTKQPKTKETADDKKLSKQLDAKISELETEIKEKDEEIFELTAKVKELEADLSATHFNRGE